MTGTGLGLQFGNWIPCTVLGAVKCCSRPTKHAWNRVKDLKMAKLKTENSSSGLDMVWELATHLEWEILESSIASNCKLPNTINETNGCSVWNRMHLCSLHWTVHAFAPCIVQSISGRWWFSWVSLLVYLEDEIVVILWLLCIMPSISLTTRLKAG